MANTRWFGEVRPYGLLRRGASAGSDHWSLFERAGYTQIGQGDQGSMLFIKLPAAGGQQ